jgi:hypothetical protein
MEPDTELGTEPKMEAGTEPGTEPYWRRIILMRFQQRKICSGFIFGSGSIFTIYVK